MNGIKSITSLVAVQVAQANLNATLKLWPKDRIKAELRKFIRAGSCEFGAPEVDEIHEAAVSHLTSES